MWNNCRIVGIVNATPDSFSDGGAYDPTAHGLQLAREGADWLDIGGESTRPGAAPVPEAEELRRIEPVIRALHRALPHLPLCIDTRKAAVAEAALAAGATVVNDVTGLTWDAAMAKVAARYGATVILMHSRGTPETMDGPECTDYGAAPVTRAVLEFWAEQSEKALAAGIAAERIWVDPGFGFAKTAAQNRQLAAEFEALTRQRFPVYVGISRKRFLGGDAPLERVAAGCRLALELMARGAAAVRTHDVAELYRWLAERGPGADGKDF